MLESFYILSRTADEGNETEASLYRSVFEDIKALGRFGNHHAKYGLESAMPLFKDIKFRWAPNSTNPIGDIMSGSVFSVRASELIRSMRSKCDIFEPIDIEGTGAFFVVSHYFDECFNKENLLDFFMCKKFGRRILVSETFKSRWERSGFLGANFSKIQENR